MDTAMHQIIAGWLQAIGSVFAIVVAWFIAHKEGERATEDLKEARDRETQRRDEERDAEKARRAEANRALGQAMTTAFNLAMNTVADARYRIDHLNMSVQLLHARISARELATVERRLLQLPPTALNDVETTVLLSDVIGHVINAQSRMEVLAGLLSTREGDPGQFLRDTSVELERRVGDIKTRRDRMLELTFEPGGAVTKQASE